MGRKQYHIGLGKGDVAPVILMVGDPARARRLARRLEDRGPERCCREYVTVTGTWRGLPVSVMATGMGPDNTEIAVVELCRIVRNPTFVRIGTCGGLAPGIRLGDLCITTGAVRLENTTSFYVPDGYPAVAHHEVVLALIAAAERLGRRYHTGITATAPSFYGAQGRTGDRAFPPRFPKITETLRSVGVVNMEMETSALLTLAGLAKARAGAVCVVFADRKRGTFVAPSRKEAFEDMAVDTGLAALEILAAMDRSRGRRPFFIPDLPGAGRRRR